MLKFIFNLSLICLLSISFTSCGSDGPDCNDAVELSQFLTTSGTNYFEALQTYSLDQSESNCKILISSTNDYIEAIESISDCLPSSERAEFSANLLEAKQELNDLDCN